MSDRLDPILYAQVFDGTPAGQKVLAELVDLFGAVTWIKGGAAAAQMEIERARAEAKIEIERFKAGQAAQEGF